MNESKTKPSVGRALPAASGEATKAAWPFPTPGVGQPAAQPAPSTDSSQGGSYLLDDATGERTLIERTQQPEGCTRHLAAQPKE